MEHPQDNPETTTKSEGTKAQVSIRQGCYGRPLWLEVWPLWLRATGMPWGSEPESFLVSTHCSCSAFG